MEVGNSIGIPLPLVAGAVISGAYVGDRSSPISSSANLTASMTGTKVIDNIKVMFTTLWPVYLFCVIVYFLLGREYILLEESLNHIYSVKGLLGENYVISWFSYLPPILLMTFALFRLPIIFCILVGILSSMVITLLTTDLGLIQLLQTLVLGYYPQDDSLKEIISGAGWISMIDVIFSYSIFHSFKWVVRAYRHDKAFN